MLTQLPSVPSLIPSSFATRAIGRDVSITIFTASSLNSGEKLFFGRGNYFTFPDIHPIGWTVRKPRGTSSCQLGSSRWPSSGRASRAGMIWSRLLVRGPIGRLGLRRQPFLLADPWLTPGAKSRSSRGLIVDPWFPTRAPRPPARVPTRVLIGVIAVLGGDGEATPVPSTEGAEMIVHPTRWPSDNQ